MPATGKQRKIATIFFWHFIQAPSERASISWGRKDPLIFDDSGRTVIAFTDGPLKRMTKQQAKSLRWKPSVAILGALRHQGEDS
jgi:hypothetical protein